MRIIDADALKKRLVKCAREGVNLNSGIARIIETAPTIDAVEVVRCKDCKHREVENGFCEGRGWPMQLVPDDGFCDKGERRSDGAD